MMESRGHPKPLLTTNSGDSLSPLLLFGVLETRFSFEGHCRCGWVYPRVDELSDRLSDSNLTWQANLLLYLLSTSTSTRAPQALAPGTPDGVLMYFRGCAPSLQPICWGVERCNVLQLRAS